MKINSFLHNYCQNKFQKICDGNFDFFVETEVEYGDTYYLYLQIHTDNGTLHTQCSAGTLEETTNWAIDKINKIQKEWDIVNIMEEKEKTFLFLTKQRMNRYQWNRQNIKYIFTDDIKDELQLILKKSLSKENILKEVFEINIERF